MFMWIWRLSSIIWSPLSENNHLHPSIKCDGWKKEPFLLNMTWTMLKDTDLNSKFWLVAVSMENYLHKWIINNSIQFNTPFEIWFGHKSNLAHVIVFDLKYPVKTVKPDIYKLTTRNLNCILLGYSDRSKVYKCFESK